MPSLEDCYRRAGRLAPWFGWPAAAFFAVGLYLVFSLAPLGDGRGENFRIAFIHAPATWVSLLIYVIVGVAAGVGLMRRNRVASMLAAALAPTGAMFAFVSLWTGALWGKPVWGVWWIWDARVSSELLLLFLFLGFIALREAVEDAGRADRAGGVLALFGLVALPVLHFSVQWWSSRQGAAIPALHPMREAGVATFAPMATMSVSLACYAVSAALTRLRVIILERERNSTWVSGARGKS